MAGTEGLIKELGDSQNMCRFIFLICLFASFVFASQKAEYFLIEDPASVRILNKYEQKTLKVLLPGTPFQVLTKDYILSDGITTAWQCKLNNELYFLLPGTSSQLNVIKNCTVLKDTILLTQDNISIHYLDGTQERLAKGQTLQRIFQKGSRAFILAERYGWCSLPKIAWKVKKSDNTVDSDFPENIHLRISARIELTNQTYIQFFQFFNEKFAKKYPVPQWLESKDGTTLKLYLSQPKASDQLKSSILILKKELEQILFGTDFQCNLERNQFIISIRSGE